MLMLTRVVLGQGCLATGAELTCSSTWLFRKVYYIARTVDRNLTFQAKIQGKNVLLVICFFV